MRARLHDPNPPKTMAVHDGDTWWMLVDWKSNGFRSGAVVCDVRLNGYSAREISQGADANRVSGREAQRIAQEVLTGAKSIDVEIVGRDRYGRDLSDVRVDDQLIGPILQDRRAVVAGGFIGVEEI